MDVKIVVYLIMLLVGVSISGIMLTSVLVPRHVEAASATKTVDRTALLTIISEPQLTVRNKTVDNEFEYGVDAVLQLRFSGQTAEKITVIPVVSFKGVKDRDTAPTEITIKNGETKQAALNFKLRSSERPMRIKDKSTAFTCPLNNLEECYVHDDELLLLQNFSFSFSAKQIDPSELLRVPFLPKIGHCTLQAEIQCPNEKRVVKLKLESESKKCSEQNDEDKDKCSRTENICGALVNLNLIEIKADEGAIGKILPGSPSCRDKKFAVDINVGRVNENIVAGKFKWKVGEDISFGFWEKPANKALENCWRDGGEGCTDFYLGQTTFTIPLDSYVVSK